MSSAATNDGASSRQAGRARRGGRRGGRRGVSSSSGATHFEYRRKDDPATPLKTNGAQISSSATSSSSASQAAGGDSATTHTPHRKQSHSSKPRHQQGGHSNARKQKQRNSNKQRGGRAKDDGAEHRGRSQSHPQHQPQQPQPPRMPLRFSAPLVDVGANLAGARFSHDVGEVIARAKQAGVTRMVLTGSSIQSTADSIKLCEQYPDMLTCTAGIHPHEAARAPEDAIQRLEQFALSPFVCAIGECGLDYNRNFSSHDAQVGLFEAQVELACRLNKPLFVHERDASQQLLDVFDRVAARYALPKIVIHCFTGNESELREYVMRGYYIGLTGYIAKKSRGATLRRFVASVVPLNRLMVETDCPYMWPDMDSRLKKYRNRNEPCTLPAIVNVLAEHCYTNLSPSDLAAATTNTACEFFDVAHPGPPPHVRHQVPPGTSAAFNAEQRGFSLEPATVSAALAREKLHCHLPSDKWNAKSADLPSHLKHITFLRHAQGVHNVARFSSGYDAIPKQNLFDAILTEHGEKQCTGIAASFNAGSPRLGLVVCSPLRRALQTASLVLGEARHREIPWVALECVRERFGRNVCDKRQSASRSAQAFPHVDFSRLSSDEDVLWQKRQRESDESLRARGFQLLDWLRDTRRESHVLVVSHDNYLSSLFTYCIELQNTPELHLQYQYLSNCEYIELIVDMRDPRVIAAESESNKSVFSAAPSSSPPLSSVPPPPGLGPPGLSPMKHTANL